MADDQHVDPRDPAGTDAGLDARVAAWLAVEPLDDVTRRRLVSTAVSAGRSEADAPAREPSRAWRWVAVAAAVVLVAFGGFAYFTADGGHDEEQAITPPRTPAAAGASDSFSTTSGAPIDVGDFGDLDTPANLDALRAALRSETSQRESSKRPEADAPLADSSTLSWLTCFLDEPDRGTIIAQGAGTLDGRRAVVVLSQRADGTRSVDAVLDGPCEVRHLS